MLKFVVNRINTIRHDKPLQQPVREPVRKQGAIDARWSHPEKEWNDRPSPSKRNLKHTL